MPQVALSLANPVIDNKRLAWLEKSLTDLWATLGGKRWAHGAAATEFKNPSVTFPDSSLEGPALEVLGHYGFRRQQG